MNGLTTKIYSRRAIFVLNNYAPQGNRQYFTNSNAIQIDGIRIELNSLLNDGYIEPNEFDFC